MSAVTVLEPATLSTIPAGTSLELTGPALSLRDASAARLAAALERGEPLPVLGAEALYALELDRFPAVVIIDRAGRNFHEDARTQWRRSSST